MFPGRALCVGLLLLALGVDARREVKSNTRKVTEVMRTFSSMMEGWIGANFGDAAAAQSESVRRSAARLLGQPEPKAARTNRKRKVSKRQPPTSTGVPPAAEGECPAEGAVVRDAANGTRGERRQATKKAKVAADLHKPSKRSGRALAEDDEEDDNDPAAEGEVEGAFSPEFGNTPFCTNGLIVYPSARINCSNETGLTVAQWQAKPEDERAACQIDESADYDSHCVCPFDVRLVDFVTMKYCAASTEVHCTAAIVDPSPALCRPLLYNLDWIQPCHWYRSDDSTTVRLNLTCTMSPDPTAWLAEHDGQDLDAKHPAQQEGNKTLAFKSIREVYETSFAGYAAGVDRPFNLTAGHFLMRDARSMAFKIYNFNRISDSAWRFDWNLKELQPGFITGERLFEFDLDFSSVPARYFHGGRLYAEAGLLFSAEHVAKILFDFTDYDPPSVSKSDEATTMAIIIVISVVAALVFCVAGILWYKDSLVDKSVVARLESDD